MNVAIPFLAFLTISAEDSVSQMLMDFVALIVITEMDNWYGAFFEIFLDAFFQESTIEDPNYLDF